MRSRSRADLGRRFLGLLPAAATAVAEGAWVAVVYAAVEVGVVRGPLVLGLWPLVLAASAGIVLARRVRGPAAGPLIAAAVGVAGVAGWASDPAVPELLGSASLGQAFAHHGAGWLAALATWRGTRHPDPTSDDLVVGSLLAWGVPGLAIPWLLGTGTETRQAYVEVALPATLVFVAAGLVAVGLTRLDALGRNVGIDWRRNRTWLALLVAVVGIVVAIGTPVALLLGMSVEAIMRAVLGPLGAIIDAVGGVLGLLAEGVERVVGSMVGSGGSSPPESGPPAGPSSVAGPGWVGTAIAVAVSVALVAGAVVLRRLTRGGRPAIRWSPPEAEERRMVLPRISVRLPRPRLPRLAQLRLRTPSSATGAYLALLRELEREPRSARAPAESPGRHARRLRAAGSGSLSLDLLAADFELERYAGASLTATEVRRAIGRWRACRSSLRPPPRQAGD